MTKSLKLDRLKLGVCYYPEQWHESLWDDDYRRMNELGFSVVRLAEFAWSIFEPQEGVFSFDLFDRAIALAHHHGLQVILGTPTATPPAWLTTRYPEVLNATQEGVIFQHGHRRHYNYNSLTYQELSARIVEKLATHYCDNSAVIGWQIDNELNCEVNVFYSAVDHMAFRDWVKEKYQTLESLNSAWGTVFWSQTYGDWREVKLSGPTPSNSPNPHQVLDEKRFFSDSAVAFASLQVHIIRKLAPKQWVTTNGIFGHLDTHKLTEKLLDFISYDSYPNFATISPDAGSDPLLDRKWSWNLSIARDISPNFCVMEQQSGPGGWVNRMVQPSPKPGQMRLWTYQSIAHGADMVLFFRWRTATMGTEIYWHGINNYDNRPNRRLQEASQIGTEFKKVGELLAGTRNFSRVAILIDYDNEWDGEFDNWYGLFNSQSNMAWFKELQYQHVPVDVKYISETTILEDLKQYELLIYCHPAIMTDTTGSLLTEYVRQGGQVVFGCRTGYKDKQGQCYMTPMPGPVAQLCGITVEDFTLVNKIETAPSISWAGTKELIGKAEGFNEILAVIDPQTEVLAEYAEDYYAGKPVLVRRNEGKGKIIYYGAVFNTAVIEAIINHLNPISPFDDWIKDIPRQVELSVRENVKTGESIVFLLNYSADSQTITFNREVAELLTGQILSKHIELPPYGVIVIKRTKV